MRLTVDAPTMAATSSPPRQSDAASEKRKPAAKSASPQPVEVTKETREPQYNRCLDLRDTVGLASLGLMTNQVWYDDPRRLTFLLARYKFVSKMLSGCRNVGEVGCGDAFGTRVVLQEVPDITVYDFDPLFIEDVRKRRDERWPLRAEIHDIVAAPLPRRHEALFSLDVLEHIEPRDEHAFLSNMCASLTDNGLLMIGTPSLESQTYASPPSKAGHVNCKSSDELKALLEKYFGHVFIYSMNDEVIHTGFSHMAHYLFALCAEPKWEPKWGTKYRGQKFAEASEEIEPSPQFEICQASNGAGFYVRVMRYNTDPERIEGFPSVAEAARWIGDNAQKRTADNEQPSS
jgi:2-polyprenyl-3-methyl-5-hydroxy-6-metoxy-1,4-benzoquinol methylase